MTWDERWLGMARLVGSWSKDRSRCVGCVIVNDRNVVVSLGWNGFPRAIDDEVESRHQRPEKYLWSEHAERNALFNAAASGNSTLNCRIYQSMYPCAHCARGIVQAGIHEVITVEPDWFDETYGDEFEITRQMFDEASVRVRFVEGETPVRAEFIKGKQGGAIQRGVQGPKGVQGVQGPMGIPLRPAFDADLDVFSWHDFTARPTLWQRICDLFRRLTR